MPELLYISMMRMPTEKAHGLQIVQNCEAFADAGYDVTLWVARRWNTREMRAIQDPYAYYGVNPNFRIRHIPCVDLFPLFPADSMGARLAFYIQMITYVLLMAFFALFVKADVYYSRDEALLAILSWLKPPSSLAYEAHLFSPSARGANLQRRVIANVGSVIAITPKLRDDLISERGATPERIIIAHDGIRQARFEHVPDRLTARQQIGWDESAFIVGFVGRLQMIGMDKGVGTLVHALAQVENASLALVGGPDNMAEQLRQQWLELGLPEDRFLYVGHVAPDEVPHYLSAFDVCAMPHPHTTQFAYYTSPLKLFEYMASHSVIVASDLPAWADVVTHEETALLVPPSDTDALATAINRLQQDPDLRQKLADHAYARIMANYTWSARVETILKHIKQAQVA
jgi:glycosyltransferase involved in cell wall biosynthesis